MTTNEIFVFIGGIILIIFLLWFFFGKKEKEKVASVVGEKQKITIVVEGAYSPSEVVVKKGRPVEIIFDRRESGDCSEWVIFEKLKITHSASSGQKSKVEEREIKAHLAPFAKTKVEFTPMETGEFPFSCGMGMLHGKLIVK